MPEAKPKLPELPEPQAWNCQLVLNSGDAIVEGWFTTKREDDPDDIPAGWDARIERVPVFHGTQARAIQAEAWNAAIEWAAKECDEHGEWFKRMGIDKYAQGRVFAAEDLADAIRRAAVPTTGDNRG